MFSSGASGRNVRPSNGAACGLSSGIWACRAFCIAIISAFLTACGGGGSSDPATPEAATPVVAPAAPACTPKPVVTVQLFGDSTFAGLDGADTSMIVPRPPGVLLQADMDARYGAGKVVVSTIGVVGGTAQSAIDGSYRSNTPLAQIPPADINVVNYMLNDVANVTLAQYRQALETFAAYAPVMVFETSANYYMPAWQDEMRAVAKEHGDRVSDLNAYFLTLPQADVINYLPDGTHGTQAWYALVVKDVLGPAVAAEVARLRCE